MNDILFGNVTDDKREQLLKQFVPIDVTESGNIIEVKTLQLENALFPIVTTLLVLLNVTDVKDVLF